MTQVYLVLTNPYSYEKSLRRALEEAKSRSAVLQVVFWIDRQELDETIHNLGDRGWLGPGTTQRLEDQLMEGYRSLAKDVMAEVQRAALQAGVTSASSIEEKPLDAYLQQLLAQEAELIVISAPKTVDTRYGNLPTHVEVIEEEWEEA